MVTLSQTSGDMASRLSHRARTRLPSAIRSLYPAEKLPGMISLLSGKPNGETFPIRRITLDVDIQSATDSTECVTLSLEGQDLEDALQYSPTAGLPRLVQWVEELQASVHKIPRQSPDWRCSIGAGSQDLLTKSLEALLDAGDTILTEKPVYPGILPQLRALGVNVVEIEPDNEGVKPSSLADTLAAWSTDESTRALAFPKVIYLTPTGGNPTGATASKKRKNAVLDIVRRHDLLLLEDDAYYYLDYSDVGGDPVTRTRSSSYLSMDPSAKNVLRFDSFSKVLSSGMRLGFCTGSPVLLAAIDQDSAGRNLQPSGVSQGVVLAVLEAWGISGFLRHADRIACFYRDRRDFFEAAAKKHLLKEPAAARWSTPTAGMFLWIELLLPSPDSFDLVSQRAKDAGVLAIPGMAFLACPRPSTFVRTSFSQVPLERVDEAFRRLRKVIDQAWAESGEARE